MLERALTRELPGSDRLPEHQLAEKLGEAAMVDDVVTLLAALLAPPILLLISEEVWGTVAEGFARATDAGADCVCAQAKSGEGSVNYPGKGLA